MHRGLAAAVTAAAVGAIVGATATAPPGAAVTYDLLVAAAAGAAAGSAVWLADIASIGRSHEAVSDAIRRVVFIRVAGPMESVLLRLHRRLGHCSDTLPAVPHRFWSALADERLEARPRVFRRAIAAELTDRHVHPDLLDDNEPDEIGWGNDGFTITTAWLSQLESCLDDEAETALITPLSAEQAHEVVSASEHLATTIELAVPVATSVATVHGHSDRIDQLIKLRQCAVTIHRDTAVLDAIISRGEHVAIEQLSSLVVQIRQVSEVLGYLLLEPLPSRWARIHRLETIRQAPAWRRAWRKAPVATARSAGPDPADVDTRFDELLTGQRDRRNVLEPLDEHLQVPSGTPGSPS